MVRFDLAPLRLATAAHLGPGRGDYPSKDGWIRLHTNAPAHRKAALAVLGTPGERNKVAAAVARWESDDLEAAVVAEGGCAAAMRSLEDWEIHPQGRALAEEPLIAWTGHEAVPPRDHEIDPQAPLRRLRVLDLTRVLAGPIASRFLAAFGADVLRIDPPDWEEPASSPR